MNPNEIFHPVSIFFRNRLWPNSTDSERFKTPVSKDAEHGICTFICYLRPYIFARMCWRVGYLLSALSISMTTNTERAMVIGCGSVKMAQSIAGNMRGSAGHCMW